MFHVLLLHLRFVFFHSRPDGTPIAMYSMGAMAQYAVVPKTAVYPIPQGVPFVDSAILGCAVFTAYGGKYCRIPLDIYIYIICSLNFASRLSDPSYL